MLADFLLQAAAFACVSPAVHDGDSLTCPGRPAMRLARIDAPELAGSRRCGRGCDGRAGIAARDHLRGLVSGRRVSCQLVDASPSLQGFQRADQYGRPVVRCSGERVGDLGEAMVRAGRARRWP